MKIVNTLKGYIVSLYASLKRFPIAIGLSITATILMIALNHTNTYSSSEIEKIITRIIMVLALGIPISLCIKLTFEKNEDVSPIIKASIYLIEAAGLVLYYFFLLKDFNMVSITRYVGLSLSFYSAFMFIPYFYRRSSFELYIVKLMTRFFTTAVYSVVLFLGIIAILFTIDKLLGIRIEEKVYFDVWLSVVGIFAVSFFLAGVPLYNEQLEADSYPKLLKVLLIYIVMPITAIYTAILYIYFAKIIVTLQWPIGMVAHLVLWYSVVCTAIVFLISPLQDESKWSRSFIFLLPKIIIPLIIMMFVSIGIRVKEYGVTENRYFVIALGLWALGIMIYLSIYKTKRNIILPVSLALIAFLSVVGPWSSYSVSKLSQNQRLESILLRYDMIKNDAIIKSDKTIAEADKREISEILRYFSKSHTLRDVKRLPKGFELSKMDETFGFALIKNNNEYQDREYFSYNSNIANNAIDIKGYSYMFTTNSYGSRTSSTSDIEMKYNHNANEVIIYKDSKEIYKTSLIDFGKRMYEKFGKDYNHDIDYNEMSFVDENENIKVKFIFNNFNGYEEIGSNGIGVNSMDFYVLVDLK